MKGQYTFYLLCDKDFDSRISTRWDWKTHTYKEVEKTGKKKQYVTLPTDDDLKADIQAFMDKHDISGSGTKAELLTKIDEYCMENGTPQEEVEYKYMASEIDKTTNHEAKLSDMVLMHPLYFAKRMSVDGSEFVVKSDVNYAEAKAIEGMSGVSCYTNEEIKEHIVSSDKWKEAE